jgi:hypothetical protein
METRTRRAAIPAALLLALWACGTAETTGDAVLDMPEDEAPDAVEEPGLELPPFARPACSREAASAIHLIDDEARLYRFTPEDLAIQSMGEIYCPVVGGGPHNPLGPMSMSVDRSAVAWVLYTNGKIYLASLEGEDCIETAFIPNQHGFDTFGMGFAADGPESETETLFAMTGSYDDAEGDHELGWIDTVTLDLEPIGPGPGRAELTGNGLGELWGLFPRSEPMSIHQLSRDTGETLQSYEFTIDRSELPECTQDVCLAPPTAWDFAFWGGRFYLFIEFQEAPSTNVYVFTPSTGELSEVLTDIGFTVVGAGVSTCAPVELI